MDRGSNGYAEAALRQPGGRASLESKNHKIGVRNCSPVYRLGVLASPIGAWAVRRHVQAEFALLVAQIIGFDLRGGGQVVLVNFWATWCPPCRREMPDLEALYQHFKKQGFVVLAISDEDERKVKPFIDGNGFTYPILLDPGGKVHQLYDIEGIPKSFVYDREGKLVAQAMDMRANRQFMEMLAQAGLQ